MIKILTYAIGGLSALIIFCVTLAALLGLEGLAILMLWIWFVVPLGMPPITIFGSVGLALLVHLLTRQSVPAEEKKTSTQTVLNLVTLPVYTIAIGFLLHIIAGTFLS